MFWKQSLRNADSAIPASKAQWAPAEGVALSTTARGLEMLLTQHSSGIFCKQY